MSSLFNQVMRDTIKFYELEFFGCQVLLHYTENKFHMKLSFRWPFVEKLPITELDAT